MAQPAAILSIVVTANAKQAQASLAKTQAQLSATTKTANVTSASMKRLGTAAKWSGAIMAGGLYFGLKKSVEEAREANKVMAQTEAVLKSTGKAAGVTAKDVESLAEKLSEKSGIDDEAIQSGENLLLTFKNIRNEASKGNQIFDQTTSLALDMSAALGQDMKSSAIKLGKALNDPSVGLTALRRVGVSFTAQQTEQILKMQESGDLMGAQKKILAELTTEFKGSAKAQADAGDRLRVIFNNMAEDVGQKVVPVLSDMAEKVSDILSNKKLSGDQKADALAKYFTEMFSKGLDALEGALPQIAEMGARMGVRFVESFVKAFLDADILGKLFLAAAFFRAVGGKGAISSVGTTSGKVFGRAFAAGAVALFGVELLTWLMRNREAITLAAQGGTSYQKFLMDEEGFSAKKALALAKVTEKNPGVSLEEAEKILRNQKKFQDQWSSIAEHGFKSRQELAENASRRLHSELDSSHERVKRGFEGTRQKLDSITKNQAKQVSGNVGSMVNAVGQGLKTLGNNTNKALQAFGAKKLSFAIEDVGKAASGVLGKQRGGPINTGAPSGDSVPALLERGEYVLNRNAVGKVGKGNLDRLNFGAAKRFATGGMVDPAGPGTGVVNKAIAGIVGAWSQKYDAAINYGYDPGGGHVSPGHNVTGTATDTGPAAGWGAGPTALFEQGLRAISGKVDQILYGSHGIGTAYPNHGWGNHAHIEWGMNPQLKGFGAVMESLKRIVLGGPDGPLKDMGQSSLDRARKAANAYLMKQAPSPIMGDIVGKGADINNLPAMFKKYNHVYAEHNSASGDYGGYQMPGNHIAALAEWVGTPGNTMEYITRGESGGRPGATGIDPGGTKGLGLWMITTGYNDALISKYGGQEQMRNPILNALAMKSIYDAQGLGAWYAAHPANTNDHWQGHFQKGGMVPSLDTGGRVTGAGLAQVHPGDVHMGRGTPKVEVHLHGPGMDAMVGEVYAVVDGAKVEIADYVMRQGGRGAGRSRQLARG